MNAPSRHPRWALVGRVLGAIGSAIVTVIGAVTHGLDRNSAALPPLNTPIPKPGPPPEYRP